MSGVIDGKALGRAICESIGIDLKKVGVCKAEIVGKPDSIAYIDLRVIIKPGLLADIEQRLQASAK